MAGYLVPKNSSPICNILYSSVIQTSSDSSTSIDRRLTKEQLQWWARNQFHEFRNIHRFFGIRYQKCPIPELRRMLLENMVEEEGEDLFGGKYPSHRDLWVQFAEGIGIGREDILNYEPLQGSRCAGDVRVVGSAKHWAVAIGTAWSSKAAARSA